MDKLRFLRCFEMRTKIEATGNGIMSGDVIYINKRNSNITSVDKKKYSELLERFVKGTRPITEENFLNITVGYSMIVRFLIEQIRKSPELWDGRKEPEELRELKSRYLKVWKIKKGLMLPEIEKNNIILIEDSDSLYFPGPNHIADSIMRKHTCKTTYTDDDDREKLWFFNGEIYTRGEALIKQEAHNEYMRQWKAMHEEAKKKQSKALSERLRELLHRGPRANDINEVIAMIKRVTFTKEEMNPGSHIPFKGKGLLNLKSWKWEEFNDEYFFTYMINATPVDRYVTLKDVPLFGNLLRTAYYYSDIPTILSYAAYTFNPRLPAEKVLFIVGTPRIGKGTTVKVLEGLQPQGTAPFSMKTILTADRFMFSGLEGKNLITDSEATRTFKRGIPLNWANFTTLFGGDTLPNEEKGKEMKGARSHAKGIVLGNLPLMKITDPAALSRIIVVETRNQKPRVRIENLSDKILEREGNLVATLLLQVLFKLIRRKWIFPGELSEDAISQLMDHLANPVEYFIEEKIEEDSNSKIREDELLEAFEDFCDENSIPKISKNLFTRTFAKSFQRKKQGTRANRVNYYLECKLALSDKELKINTEEKVGHGFNYTESQNLRDSGERYRRVHLLSPILYMREREDTCKKEKAQKSDTYFSNSETNEIKGFEHKKSVSNFFHEKESSPEISETKPSKSLANGGIQADSEKVKDQSYQIEETILNLLKQITRNDKSMRVEPSIILSNLALNGIYQPITLKEMNERILPTMAGEGLISFSNGKISLTGKKLKEPKSKEPDKQEDSHETHYISLSMLEDRSFSATDGKDYTLHKGQTASIPEDTAKILIQRKWAIEVKEGDQQ